MGKGVFVTGTGTDIGKTYVTGLIVKKLRDAGLNAGYYKAAISGAEKGPNGELLAGDALYVNKVAGIGETQENLVSYVYLEAVSPHLAAKINNQQIDFDHVDSEFHRALKKFDYLTMEGSGGIICPLRWDEKEHVIIDDLVKRLGLGCIVIADAGLGTINSAVLTIEHLRARDIAIKGVILNNFHDGDVMEEDNKKMITEITGVPVIATVKKGDTDLGIDVEKLKVLYD
ncbi:MAG: dethiobiotin synthase [Selenomonadaceae bacterium]